jgi:hypothetical protein
VPVAVRSITFSLCSVPVKLAATTMPLAQFAVTVPPTDEAVCAVISHFTSEQLPSGRPAIVDEPHAPANADAAVVLPVEPVEDEPVEPVVVVLPAAPLTLEGDVGPRSFDVCSNAQPVASVEASNKVVREAFFMIGPYSFVWHTQFWYVPTVRSLKISGNRKEHLRRCRIKARTPLTRQNR